MNEEEWRPVVGYEGLYEVSNLGRVKSLAKTTTQRKGVLQFRPERILKPIHDRTSTGYLYVNLARQGKGKKIAIHALVLAAFVGPRPSASHQACHNDGSRVNARLDNLRWDTIAANAADVLKHGRRIRGEKSPVAKLTENEVRSILESNESSLKLAPVYGVASSTIRAIRISQNWKHVSGAAKRLA